MSSNSSFTRGIDRELKDASEIGDTEILYAIINDNPNILDEIDEIPFVDTPLHIVASFGDHDQAESSQHQKRAEFAIEVAILKPAFTRKLNPKGLTPMHLALSSGAWTMVRALMTHDPELVRVKGRGGMTPLHVAAAVAPPELLAELLFACPSSVEDVNAQWQTAVHLAVETGRWWSFEALVQWLSSVGKEELLTWQDIRGNTVLHAATRTNQILVVRRLVKLMKDDTENFSGQKAITIYENDDGLHRSEEIGFLLLHQAKKQGIFRAAYDANMSGEYYPKPRYGVLEYLLFTEAYAEWRRMTRFVGKMTVGNDNFRQVLMVVAALVAAATYQGILSPPGGFWQDSSSSSISNTTTIAGSATNITTPHYTGKMVMDAGLISKFLYYNTTAFVFCICLLIACVPANPFFGPCLLFVLFSVLFTYRYALHSIIPPGFKDPGFIYLGRSPRKWADLLITLFSIVAAVCICYRVFAAVISAVLPKLRLEERGITRPLLHPLIRDDHGKRDSHINHGNNENLDADAGHLYGLEDP